MQQCSRPPTGRPRTRTPTTHRFARVTEMRSSRKAWADLEPGVRVIAVRLLERQGKQLPLFDGLDWTVQVFLTDRPDEADDIAWDYDRRAGIEAILADLKGLPDRFQAE
jgi:hypothetical protein